MSSLAAATLVVGFLVLVGGPILWLIFRSGAPHPAVQAVADREFVFQPAVPASLRDLGDGRAESLAFGNDGAGDEYLVDLRKANPPVVYRQHDSGRQYELAANLAEFLQLPRRQSVEADD